MVEQKDRITPVDYDTVKMEIFVKANAEGPIDDIESWKKAFPDIEFPEIDDDFTGDPIDWKNRTAEERAFYIAYMKDPQAAKVKYSMDVDGVRLWKNVDDSEVIWNMWMEGCFSGEEFDEEAIRTFVWYADSSELARRYIEDLDLADIKLLNLSIEVAPLQ